MAEFVMPNLGADMEAATLMTWHVKCGDAVKRGDVIAEVETDKGLIEIECFETGVITEILTDVGAKIPVGGVMAVIQTGDGTGTPRTRTQAPPPTPQAESNTPTLPVPHASPLAKKIAAELQVDLTKLTGTGPGGLIDREDVERAAISKPAGNRLRISPLARKLASEFGVDVNALTSPSGVIERADVERAAAAAKPITPAHGSDGMRRAIAAAMAKSNREIPHYYLQTRIDMSCAMKWLEMENLKRSMADRLLLVVVLLKAVAKSLRDVPGLNGFWIDNEHRISDAIHLGFAISMKGGGLVAPAIHDVDKHTCDELMRALRDLIPRARSGRLRSSEMTDSTLTITSLGDLGVESVLGVIYPPQVGLVGFGKVLEQPWAKDGMLGVHPIMVATLAADHRATDGHIGAQFLDALNQHLQTPELL
jgi:pyruvate dehydrogenase E2 component (dihydrolipoamide acetyltransferase)